MQQSSDFPANAIIGAQKLVNQDILDAELVR